MTIAETLTRWCAASEAGNPDEMDETARAVLRADDARKAGEAASTLAEAREAIMAAVGEAAGAGDDEGARNAALAKISPDHRAAFLAVAPEAEPPLLDEAGDDWTPAPLPREWLIPEWLPAGRVAMLTGTGKVGKSRLALQLAAALASDTDQWLPSGARLASSDPAVAVIASWEDEADELQRRLHEIGRMQFPPMSPASVEDRLRFVHPVGGSLWAEGEAGAAGKLTLTGGAVREYCERRKARLLVLDPRAAAFACNENDRSAVRAFVSDWDAWARATGCAVLLIAHPPKGDYSYSGSTDWQAATRAVWELAKAKTPNGGEEAPRLRCEAVSYGKVPAPAWLHGYPLWQVTTATHAASEHAKLTGAAPGRATGGFSEPPPE